MNPWVAFFLGATVGSAVTGIVVTAAMHNARNRGELSSAPDRVRSVDARRRKVKL